MVEKASDSVCQSAANVEAGSTGVRYMLKQSIPQLRIYTQIGTEVEVK